MVRIERTVLPLIAEAYFGIGSEAESGPPDRVLDDFIRQLLAFLDSDLAQPVEIAMWRSAREPPQ